MLDVFLGIGLCASSLLAALALGRRGDARGRGFLALWLAAYGAFFLGWIGALRLEGAAGYALAALASSAAMAPPALQWLYARALAGEPARRAWLHLAPAFINLALMLALGAASLTAAEGGAITLNLPPWLAPVAAAPVFVLAAVSVYPALAWRTAAHAGARLRDARADESVRAFAWIKVWAAAALALNAVLIASSLAANMFGAPLAPVVVIAVGAVAAQVAFVAWRGLTMMAPVIETAPAPAAPLEPPQASRADAETFDRFMRDEKPFLDAGINAEALSAKLGWPRERLTAAVRAHGESFFDCVNRYRVEEAKRLIDTPENAAVSLLSIAMDSGFGSKSSFNAAFRKHASVTPTQYHGRARGS